MDGVLHHTDKYIQACMLDSEIMGEIIAISAR